MNFSTSRRPKSRRVPLVAGCAGAGECTRGCGGGGGRDATGDDRGPGAARRRGGRKRARDPHDRRDAAVATPPLAAGTYDFRLRATWQDRTTEQVVRVRSGQKAAIDFRAELREGPVELIAAPEPSGPIMPAEVGTPAGPDAGPELSLPAVHVAPPTTSRRPRRLQAPASLTIPAGAVDAAPMPESARPPPAQPDLPRPAPPVPPPAAEKAPSRW